MQPAMLPRLPPAYCTVVAAFNSVTVVFQQQGVSSVNPVLAMAYDVQGHVSCERQGQE